MKLKTVQWMSLVLLMLVTGVFWGTWFTLTRSLNDFAAEEFIHIGKVIIVNVAMPMRIIFPFTVLFMLLMLWWYFPKQSAGFYWGIAALAFTIITLVITLTVLVPIDNQIKEWTTATVPADWEAIRDKWDRYHALRTYTSLAGFASLAVSIIFRKQL